MGSRSNLTAGFQVLYLGLLCMIGSVGNSLVVCTIVYRKAVLRNQNIFIINLAIADFIITGMIVPIIMANVINGDSVLNNGFCTLMGFLVTVTCCCSTTNLCLISTFRYLKARKGVQLSKEQLITFAVMSWFYATAISLPPLFNWSTIEYDEKMYLCSWDDDNNRSYTWFLFLTALGIPIALSTFFYSSLFRLLYSTRRRTTSVASSNSQQSLNTPSRAVSINLLQMLAVTTGCFFVCWFPYGCYILVNPKEYGKLKMFLGWLAISNSCINFLIYGYMNHFFRDGYIEFLYWCAAKVKNITYICIYICFCWRGQGGVRGSRTTRSDDDVVLDADQSSFRARSQPNLEDIIIPISMTSSSSDQSRTMSCDEMDASGQGVVSLQHPSDYSYPGAGKLVPKRSKSI